MSPCFPLSVTCSLVWALRRPLRSSFSRRPRAAPTTEARSRIRTQRRPGSRTARSIRPQAGRRRSVRERSAAEVLRARRRPGAAPAHAARPSARATRTSRAAAATRSARRPRAGRASARTAASASARTAQTTCNQVNENNKAWGPCEGEVLPAGRLRRRASPRASASRSASGRSRTSRRASASTAVAPT